MIDYDKGEPAFPCEFDYLNSNRAKAVGMSLRDYFAAAAMTGLASRVDPKAGAETWAFLAYQYADAMLSERAK